MNVAVTVAPPKSASRDTVRGNSFRNDINGLRAWAVLGVVLYHFGVAPFGGGFAGVDVFFVISGYLMCGIVQRGLERGEFSFWRFYMARARRIWPALLVLCLVVLLLGWFFLMPEEYERLGRHARESLLFSSNFEYFEEAGYFDVSSREKWLLHTWSLSVEWQFYLLFPIFLFLLLKSGLGQRGTSLFIAALLIASFILCVLRSQQSPGEAFYLLHTRAWEMLAGAMVYRVSGLNCFTGKSNRLLEWIGFALILFAFIGFNSKSLWPSWLAAIPVAGAALILLARHQQSSFTNLRPLQWLGSCSYSVYLWHWPVVVSLAYFELLDEASWVAIGLAVSLGLGYLSYCWIESPSRRFLAALPPRRAFTLLFILVIVSVTFAQQVRRSGFPERLPEAVAQVEAASSDKNPRSKYCLTKSDNCIYGEGELKAILVGDSHADHLIAGMMKGRPSGEGQILFKGVAACFVAFDVRSSRGNVRCDELNRWLERNHDTLPAGVPLIFSGIYSEYTNKSQISSDVEALFYFNASVRVFGEDYFRIFREKYLSMVCEVARERPVYLVRPTPTMPVDVPQTVGRAMLLNEPVGRVGVSLHDYGRRNSFMLSVQDEAVQRCGVGILDPLPFLCEGGYCSGIRNGRPLYRDTSHLTETASRSLSNMFSAIFFDNP